MNKDVLSVRLEKSDINLLRQLAEKHVRTVASEVAFLIRNATGEQKNTYNEPILMINREEVKDCKHKEVKDCKHKEVKDCKHKIEDQQNLVRCSECKYWFEYKRMCLHEKRKDGNRLIFECENDFFCTYGEKRK